MPARKEIKSILNKHKKRDSWFLDEYSINPYEGCGFNCSYCYVRGSKYGENLAEKITVKNNAVEILDKQLASRAKKNQFGIIAIGSATDAYMQVEESTQLTRQLLEVILKHRFPVFIATKSVLIERDFDLLQKIDTAAILPDDLRLSLGRGAIISFSVSTLDEKLARILEPGAPSPLSRLKMLQKSSSKGLLSGLNCMPVLPFISDTNEELEKMIRTAKEHQSDYVLVGGLTLFGNENTDSKTIYYRFLQKYYPQLWMEYEKMYGGNYYSSWQYQQGLQNKVANLCKQYNIKNSIL